ncbi:MAG: hypothetical protein LBC98_03420 [Prevotellaceae bacterium]|jgi:hypothetical protein|nr:hypothetical protein [Prevotellaceae bacterium]
MIALALGAIIISCGQDKIQTISSDEVAGIPAERIDSMTIMTTENGKIRYRVIAKTADRLRLADTPYYNFPHGLYAASFSEDGSMESDIVADSASLRSNPDFFTSYGNVVIRNSPKNTRVETQGPLYWDAAKKAIYTNVYAVVYTLADTVPAYKGLITDDKLKNTIFYSVKDGTVNRVFTPERDSTAAVADTIDTKYKAEAKPEMQANQFNSSEARIDESKTGRNFRSDTARNKNMRLKQLKPFANRQQ